MVFNHEIVRDFIIGNCSLTFPFPFVHHQPPDWKVERLLTVETRAPPLSTHQAHRHNEREQGLVLDGGEEEEVRKRFPRVPGSQSLHSNVSRGSHIQGTIIKKTVRRRETVKGLGATASGEVGDIES